MGASGLLVARLRDGLAIVQKSTLRQEEAAQAPLGRTHMNNLQHCGATVKGLAAEAGFKGFLRSVKSSRSNPRPPYFNVAKVTSNV